MKEKIKKYISENGLISPGSGVCVAFSGGADSSCLLHLLNELSNELGFTLEAVHVNHMLRGGESDKDEKFCRKVCEDLGIPFEAYSADVKKTADEKGMTVEEAARSERYGVFEKNCKGTVALAHNLNDNAETLLMNIMRGSGPEGLGGMSPKTGRYIRPLLETTRAEIEEYCEENGIKHVEDSSNEDTSYFRNAVRHRLLPLMDTISGRDTVKRVSATARMMSLLNSYMDSITENHFEKHVAIRDKRAVVDNAKVMKLHPYMASCVVRKAVEKIKGDLKDVESRNTEILLGMMGKNRTGEATEIAQGLFALVQFGYTVIYKKDEILPGYEYDLPVPGKITISERNLTVTAAYDDSDAKTDPAGQSHLLNISCCKEGLKVRTRKNGDIIKPDRGIGTAKLKKYFIDKKTMLPWRNEKMLIACGSSIALVEGMDYGRDYLPRKGENIRIEIRREDADD